MDVRRVGYYSSLSCSDIQGRKSSLRPGRSQIQAGGLGPLSLVSGFSTPCGVVRLVSVRRLVVSCGAQPATSRRLPLIAVLRTAWNGAATSSSRSRGWPHITRRPPLDADAPCVDASRRWTAPVALGDDILIRRDGYMATTDLSLMAGALARLVPPTLFWSLAGWRDPVGQPEAAP